MEWMKGEYSKLISFVSASGDDKSRKRKTESRKVNGNLEGTEVRNFYEDIINEESSSSVKIDGIQTCREKICPENRRKDNSCSKTQANRSDITQIDINRYLRYAQEGNLRQLKVLISKGVPVDSHDQYGWSALMCAAHSGQLNIVKYLLSAGLKTDIVDRHNKSASDIAGTAGFPDISKFIETWKPGSTQVNFPVEKSQDSESFYCDICKQKFTESSLKNHESSMVHIFNSKKKAKDDPFLIPSSNRGYKIMLKSGWDGREGLGSEGQGQRYPVKTILKKDRKCLGSEKEEKPKITHFNANDKMAITKNPERKLSKRGLIKKDQKQKVKRQKQWERNLRTTMSLDF
ncbi:G patch domain and ankyrin repeat-containing protein 1-like [Mytilus californianus]|uniref:G patch domain and ankyrin repeat-containing protein 1-like n=1 Tax=Mytilus californianus TaxID=6549 RepID=UPI0022477E0F|nr:G patch domain and ankyrin repeat-containing protein 1-like [Mytilus californianus]XP_052068400.1 G patch domain and ankyrin repeat-containing protein 1-like [Mytilus californianus]XP_052068401.1 G patch domain and ankyrin repeat-containing protein 1-like [Mytilus californianus]XP_052068402.1 G patch domain and ankyrin repeat-containing protein 1-like [Mytilus californianus]